MKTILVIVVLTASVLASGCGSGGKELADGLQDNSLPDDIGTDSILSETAEVVLDLEPPTAPGDLAATVTGSTGIDLTWAAATDNVGVSGYKVFVGETEIATGFMTGFSHAGLTPGHEYCYTVKAFDLAGNVSVQSNEACATTQSATDVTETQTPETDAADDDTADAEASIDPPTVSSITPTMGINDGPVNITALVGTNFLPGASVKLTRSGQNDISCTSISVVNSTELTCTCDLAGALAGTWNVVVTNTDAGTGTLANGFTIVDLLTVTAVNPTSGYDNGPVSLVSITGTGFVTGATVKLTKTGQSNISCTETTVASATSITGGSCPITSAELGTWNVVVSTPDSQTAKLTNGFVVMSSLVAPSAPQNLTATRGNHRVDLLWSAPSSNGGTAITSYKVYRGTTSGEETLLLSGGCSGLGAVLSCADIALSNGTTYYYKVSAVNAVGEGAQSNPAGATPATTPLAPQNFSATRGNQLVTLTWSVPSSNGGAAITSYNVYRSITSGGEILLTSGGCFGFGATLTCTDAGLTNGDIYYYKVSAVNAVGEGLLSVEVNATPATIPSAPQNPTVAAGVAQVLVSFSPPSSDGGDPITLYTVTSVPDGLTGTGSTSPIMVNGLTSGSSYSFTVVATNLVGTGPAATVSGSVAPLATVAGKLNSSVEYGLAHNAFAIAMGNINNDAYLDLVATNYLEGGGKVAVFMNLWNGSPGSFTPRVDYPTNDSHPENLAIGNLNSDSYADLVVSNLYGSNISVFLNKGDGTFPPASKTDYAITGSGFTYARSVVIGNLDNDSYPDIAVLNSYDSAHKISVFMNKADGTGTFLANVDYTSPGSSSMTIGDFNQDSRFDLVVATGNGFSVFMNNGSGGFPSHVEYATGEQIRSVTVGNLNGDAYPDLAVVGYGDPGLMSVYLNNGSGAFPSKSGYITDQYPDSIAIGDLNGDSYPDVAVVNGSNSVSVFGNTANGIITSRVDYTSGRATSVIIGDLNNDSHPDLATANNYDWNISVLLNNGSRTKETEQ